MQVMGSLQWFDLLARSKLAVYDTIYDFELLPNPDVSQVMPPAARGELQAHALSIFTVPAGADPRGPPALGRPRPSSLRLSAES